MFMKNWSDSKGEKRVKGIRYLANSITRTEKQTTAVMKM